MNRFIGKLIFIMLIGPLLASCSTVRKIDSPTGVTYEATCNKASETFLECFNQAAETCPKGYRLIDSVDKAASVDVITDEPIPSRRNLYFHCNDLR